MPEIFSSFSNLFRIFINKKQGSSEADLGLRLSKAQLENALRQAGYRITRPRQAILSYLAAAESHPGAWEIYQEVRKSHPGLSLATVYNTLSVLARSGLVKMLEFEQQSRWETNLTPHINLICLKCGKISDLEGNFPLQPEDLLNQVDFQVLDYRMEYYGICSECRETQD